MFIWFPTKTSIHYKRMCLLQMSEVHYVRVNTCMNIYDNSVKDSFEVLIFVNKVSFSPWKFQLARYELNTKYLKLLNCLGCFNTDPRCLEPHSSELLFCDEDCPRSRTYQVSYRIYAYFLGGHCMDVCTVWEVRIVIQYEFS